MIYNALLAASESLPVVDIDNTVFLQGILFLLMFVVLHFLLFKPWLEVRERRASKISGAIDEAKSLRERADAAGADYDARLSKARDEAMSLRSDRRREAEDEEQKIVTAARKEATTKLEARKQELAEQSEQARADLSSRVASLSDDVVQQILGRSA